MQKKISLLILSLMIVPGVAFGMIHTDDTDPDADCKKWVGMVELAEQDYPHFVENTLVMAEKKCGFDVNDITS